MTKLAAIGELGDGVDTSVPGIEGADLNDGDILAATGKELRSDGTFRFVYTPPDGGEPITSDFIQQDFEKKAIFGWIDGVKNAIIGRARGAIDEANERAAEARARKRRELDNIEESDVQTPTLHAPAIPAKRRTDVGTDVADPGRYVLGQLEEAQRRLEAAEDAYRELSREVVDARASVNKWQRLADALSAPAGGPPAVRPKPAISRNVPLDVADYEDVS